MSHRVIRASPRRTRARGLGAITVIVVLVGLAAMAAAVLRLGQVGASVTAQDIDGARASAAARTGVEWGLYQAFKGSWTVCSNASTTLDAGNGLRVTVLCDSRSFNEGESSPGVPRTVRAFTIDAVACRSSDASTPCPDAAAAVLLGYVERRRQVQAMN
jgi:MSHA biogenesis protein MshP